MQVQKAGGRLFALVVIAGCISLGLAACGRKSALDPPPNAAIPARSTTSQAGQPADSQGPAQEEAASASARRDRGFILDPLLR
jgi:predicted small lipoprotein YifL